MMEYSLDNGGSWSTAFDSENADYVWNFASPACSSNGVTCSTHVSTLSLTDLQHTDQIQVRATLRVQLPHCDNCTLRVSNNAGTIWVNDIRVIADPCDIPTAESTASVGWGLVYDVRTVHAFQMTLTPAGTTSLSGRTVTEADPVPGGGATDTCYFTGSAIPKQTTVVSGGTWTVDSANQYGTDGVGITEGWVNYYQGAATLPCFMSGPQRMSISCPTGTGPVPYIENTLESGVYVSAVSAQRQGNFQQRAWP